RIARDFPVAEIPSTPSSTRPVRDGRSHRRAAYAQPVLRGHEIAKPPPRYQLRLEATGSHLRACAPTATADFQGWMRRSLADLVHRIERSLPRSSYAQRREKAKRHRMKKAQR